MTAMMALPTAAGQAATAAAPSRVLLAPWGAVESSKGDFTIDADSAGAIVRAFKARDVDLVIDYEHQSLGGSYGRRDGTAPAAGWITAMEVEPGRGIFGRVTWTDEGQRLISAKQYRYLSPVLRADTKGRPIAMDSVGLVNQPAIHRMPAIVNSHRSGGDMPADCRIACPQSLAIEARGGNMVVCKNAAGDTTSVDVSDDPIIREAHRYSVEHVDLHRRVLAAARANSMNYAQAYDLVCRQDARASHEQRFAKAVAHSESEPDREELHALILKTSEAEKIGYTEAYDRVMQQQAAARRAAGL